MSYIESTLSPYRGNLEEEIGEILLEDHEMVCREITGRGLIFLIAYIVIMGISLLKVIFHVFDHYSKPERPLPQITRGNVEKATDLTYLCEMKEARNCNQNQYRTKNQEAHVNATIQLRNYLYSNDLELEGTILKEVNHKVDDFALLKCIHSGYEEMPKLSTTYITFGEDIDYLLAEVLPSKPKKRTVQGVKCLAFENDYGFIAEELKQIYQESVKVTFDSM